jgi:hypothetical protein
MDTRRCRQVIVTLALSLFVAWATHQIPGLIAHNIFVLLSLLLFTGLILFVVHHRSTLCSIVRVCLGELAGVLSIQPLWRGRVTPTVVIYAPSKAFGRRFLFQLPPPILSL